MINITKAFSDIAACVVIVAILSFFILISVTKK